MKYLPQAIVFKSLLSSLRQVPCRLAKPVFPLTNAMHDIRSDICFTRLPSLAWNKLFSILFSLLEERLMFGTTIAALAEISHELRLGLDADHENQSHLNNSPNSFHVAHSLFSRSSHGLPYCRHHTLATARRRTRSGMGKA